MKALECRNVTVSYGSKTALSDVSFTLEENESLAILGSNGSGKTTLLRSVTAMTDYKGEIFIKDKNLSGMTRHEIASDIALLTQLSQVYYSYSVYETVLLGRYLHRKHLFWKESATDREVVERSMESTGVAALSSRQLSELSGGELQRVFLARTFAQESPILLLDEPTNHLDLKIHSELCEYLDNWRKQEGHTLIGVYHDIPTAFALSDRILLLKEGKPQAFAPKAEILRSDLLAKTYDFDVIRYLQDIILSTAAPAQTPQ